MKWYRGIRAAEARLACGHTLIWRRGRVAIPRLDRPGEEALVGLGGKRCLSLELAGLWRDPPEEVVLGRRPRLPDTRTVAADYLAAAAPELWDRWQRGVLAGVARRSPGDVPATPPKPGAVFWSL